MVISDVYFDVAMIFVKMKKTSKNKTLFSLHFLLAQSDPFYFVYSFQFISKWTMDFCSILKITKVDVGNIVKRVKIWRVLLLEVFLLVGFLTELCLYMYCKDIVRNSEKSNMFRWQKANTKFQFKLEESQNIFWWQLLPHKLE